jgi:IS1 family transposase
MNKLTPERRAAVVKALVEGNSVRATCRITGTAKGTVLRLLLDIGEACERFHDERVRAITASRIQCDEVWSFISCKERLAQQRARFDVGDIWTWVALDADSKLAVSFYVGRRGVGEAETFMLDLRSRLAGRVQLTTDGHRPYLAAVANAFGSQPVDFAMLHKTYGHSVEKEAARRYSPPVCTGAEKIIVCGNPDERFISTSYVENANLTIRMQQRRFTRLTNAFSKKLLNHCAAVALHFVHYNWCKVHGTLTTAKGGIHTTPAMAAGLTDRVWTVADLIGLLENEKAN